MRTDVLVVDDGSSDATPELLAARHDIKVVRHAQEPWLRRGVKSAFDYAIRFHYDVLVTIDCDGQHEPQRIRRARSKPVANVDIVSGSRYLDQSDAKGVAPPERRRINELITQEINQLLGLSLTDAFCGFKAYRVAALEKLDDHRPRLRHAAGALGAGGPSRFANRRSTRSARSIWKKNAASAAAWTMAKNAWPIIMKSWTRRCAVVSAAQRKRAVLGGLCSTAD